MRKRILTGTDHDANIDRYRKMTKEREPHITHVSFRANVSVDSKFNHAHVEAGADVAPGDDPTAVLAYLKTFVATELRKAKEGEPVPQPSGRFRV